MSLIHLVYVSSATQIFTDADLVGLLETSRRNNLMVGVTGLLLYREGNFMQVLEGQETAVNATHARIEKDPRHKNLITMLREPIERPDFQDWSMGFRNLESAAIHRIKGYSEFLNEDWRGGPMQKSPQRALKLIHVFRQGNR